MFKNKYKYKISIMMILALRLSHGLLSSSYHVY